MYGLPRSILFQDGVITCIGDTSFIGDTSCIGDNADDLLCSTLEPMMMMRPVPHQDRSPSVFHEWFFFTMKIPWRQEEYTFIRETKYFMAVTAMTLTYTDLFYSQVGIQNLMVFLIFHIDDTSDNEKNTSRIYIQEAFRSSTSMAPPTTRIIHLHIELTRVTSRSIRLLAAPVSIQDE